MIELEGPRAPAAILYAGTADRCSSTYRILTIRFFFPSTKFFQQCPIAEPTILFPLRKQKCRPLPPPDLSSLPKVTKEQHVVSLPRLPRSPRPSSSEMESPRSTRLPVCIFRPLSVLSCGRTSLPSTRPLAPPEDCCKRPS